MYGEREDQLRQVTADNLSRANSPFLTIKDSEATSDEGRYGSNRLSKVVDLYWHSQESDDL